MNSDFKIEWSDGGKKDLREIIGYIKTRDNIENAKYVKSKLLERIAEISTFPTKHPIEKHFNNTSVRYAIKWHYKIIFEIRANSILIISIFHTAQHPSKIELTE